MTHPILEVAGFLLGLLFGSFLNVLIVRVPRGESIVRPGSHCLACGHAIRPFDNIPVLSWLVLRGRCRDCGAVISWRYPAVELACGLWFALAVRQSSSLATPNTAQPIVLTLTLAILGFLLIGLVVMDWQTQRLPDAFTLAGIAIGLGLACTQAALLGEREAQINFTSKHLRLSSPGSFAARGNVFLTGPEAVIYGRIAAICGAALLLLLVRWGYRAARGREGLGLGDVKLLAMIAAFLGFWPAVLALFGGVLLATVYASVLLVRGRAHGLTRLPLGSFLGAAGLLVALGGDNVIAWYRTLL